MKTRAVKMTLSILLVFCLSGCTFIFQKGRRSDALKIKELSDQLNELSQARRLLEARLSEEIGDKQVRLDMMEKGLVITVVGDLLFDSGKAKIRSEAYNVLNKVAGILKEDVPQYDVGIEGHTDNQPIKFSGWKTNWELSTARALSVLHFLVNEKNISPQRLSAVGYGEFHPVASNDSREGKQLNRRVEIVIMPQLTKVRQTEAEAKAKKNPESAKIK